MSPGPADGNDRPAAEPLSASGADEDEAKLADLATRLVAEVETALPDWVAGAVAARHPGPLSGPAERRLEQARIAVVADVGARLGELLAVDIDEQWTNPLSIIRTAVRYPTEVLALAGVPGVDRDDQAVRFHPDDVYDLVPAAFADLGPAVHEAGLLWGAAKAHVHLRRRREAG